MRPETQRLFLRFLPAAADIMAFAVSSLMAWLALSVLAGAVNAQAFRDAAAFAFLLGILLLRPETPEMAVRGFDAESFLRLGARVTGICALTFVLTVLTGEGFTVFPFEIWVLWIILGTGCLVVGRALARSVVAALYRRKVSYENVIIVCAGMQGMRLAEWLRRRAPHIRTLGFFEDRKDRVDMDRLPAACLGGIADAVEYCQNHTVDRIFVALPGMAEARIAEIVEILSILPVTITMSPDLAFLSQAQVGKLDGAGLPVFDLSGRPITGWRAVLKRAEDIAVALVALIVFSPLFLVIPVLIKMESPGPVFFRQPRYGFGYKPFNFLKFRSMYVEHCAQEDIKLTERQDPRVTKIGNFLRRTSLDELPQFINVLKGDMSVVGPRPHPAGVKAGERTYEEVINAFARRYRVKPGITGWAQINGARGNTFTEDDIKTRFALDMYYIQNWSLWLDMVILLRTLVQGFVGRNAF
ncbi:MAG: undecaprenyl-phosphate glucose phosphotransferase [Rhodospirillales bacterium]|nr:undecaprenyl-phosphate glucose phosphotransferase [Rhodospirillales bacterium]